MSERIDVQADVSLAPLTTLELGGRAEYLVEVAESGTLLDAVRWAERRGLDVTVLAGGSNVVVLDGGVPGLVVRVASAGVHAAEKHPGLVEVTAAAGETWDDLVAWAVAEGLAGIECLSGIPGTVGGTPIQNVGAYGQEVAESIVGVRVLDRRVGCERTLTNAECSFSYRSSVLRTFPRRYTVLSVTFALARTDTAAVRYEQLAEALGASRASLAEVRAAVLALRRSKSMLLEASDPNRRSVGSFFTNPVVSVEMADRVAARAATLDAARAAGEMRRWPVSGDGVKLSAAWLIERAGFARGERRGAVGLSSRHVLALVHHGGGRTSDLLALAAEIQARVHALFGVTLRPEPVLLGSVGTPPPPW